MYQWRGLCEVHTAKADTHMESISLHLHLHLHLRRARFFGHLRNGNSDGSNDDVKLVTVMAIVMVAMMM